MSADDVLWLIRRCEERAIRCVPPSAIDAHVLYLLKEELKFFETRETSDACEPWFTVTQA